MLIISIFGVSIVLILGIVNLLLILFQILSGYRIIKVKMKVHRYTGITLLVTAAIHGIIAILATS